MTLFQASTGIRPYLIMVEVPPVGPDGVGLEKPPGLLGNKPKGEIISVQSTDPFKIGLGPFLSRLGPFQSRPGSRPIPNWTRSVPIWTRRQARSKLDQVCSYLDRIRNNKPSKYKPLVLTCVRGVACRGPPYEVLEIAAEKLIVMIY